VDAGFDADAAIDDFEIVIARPDSNRGNLFVSLVLDLYFDGLGGIALDLVIKPVFRVTHGAPPQST